MNEQAKKYVVVQGWINSVSNRQVLFVDKDGYEHAINKRHLKDEGAEATAGQTHIEVELWIARRQGWDRTT